MTLSVVGIFGLGVVLLVVAVLLTDIMLLICCPLSDSCHWLLSLWSVFYNYIS